VNAFSKAQKGYSSNSVTTQTDRRSEYDLIARLTHRMRATAIEAKDSYPQYVQALHDNRKLWNALAIDVADKDNELPSQLRAQLFYLAEFTAQHTTKILKDGLSVAPLLEINLAVLRGLKTGESVQ
jgi:flagellar protein FlaF